MAKADIEAAWTAYAQNEGMERNDFEALVRSFEERYADGYYVGKVGHFVLVGHGEKTNDYCGKFRKLMGCKRVHLHDKVDLLTGVNYAGKVYVKPVFCTCNKPSCPVCFLRGWDRRESEKIAERIREAEKLHGRAQHVLISLSKGDYGLSYEQFKAKLYRVMKARGIHGGCFIFHAFRYANFKESLRKKVPFGWYFSVHFHIIGFIDDSFDKCRSCRFRDARGSRYCCKNCDGFYGRSKKAYLKDKAIVEVLSERKSIFRTAFYQLSHATMRDNTKRAQVVTWFGSCSYRKLKVVPKEKQKLGCPICQKELMHIRYTGGNVIIVNRHHPDFKEYRFMDAFEDGKQVFFEVGSDG